jgi:hypothetical protein
MKIFVRGFMSLRQRMRGVVPMVLMFFGLMLAIVGVVVGCGSGTAPAVSTENEGATPAADPIGERLFLDTRFAKFFFQNMTAGDRNAEGRNFGWAPADYNTAIHHIATIIRGDNGSDQLAADRSDGLSYGVLFKGVDPRITSDILLPPSQRIDVTTSTDMQVVEEVALCVAQYFKDRVRGWEGLLGGSGTGVHDCIVQDAGSSRSGGFGSLLPQWQPGAVRGCGGVLHQEFSAGEGWQAEKCTSGVSTDESVG